MTWAKLDDTFWMHLKVLQAGDAAAGVYARMLSYCAGHLTDGFVPDGALAQMFISTECLNTLERARLVRRGAGGVVIHDYLDYNRSREQVAAIDALAHQRRERYRAAVGSATSAQVQARVAFYGGLCWLCRTNPYQSIDHVKPLAAGGSNWPANLRPACITCNSRKGAKWPLVRYGS